MAAPTSRICCLYFSGVGESGETTSIFIHLNVSDVVSLTGNKHTTFGLGRDVVWVQCTSCMLGTVYVLQAGLQSTWARQSQWLHHRHSDTFFNLPRDAFLPTGNMNALVKMPVYSTL